MALRCPRYGCVEIGDNLVVGGVVTHGAEVKCQSLSYDIDSRLSVRDDPCVRILCYMGVLAAVSMLWILCMYSVQSAYSVCHFAISPLLF